MAIAEIEEPKKSGEKTSTGFSEGSSTPNPDLQNFGDLDQTTKSYGVYANIKDFKFSTPEGWNDYYLWIFVQCCKKNLNDLRYKSSDEDKWSKIAELGAKTSGNSSCFTVNSCLELASCLTKYIINKGESLRHNIYFKKFYSDIDELLQYFTRCNKQAIIKKQTPSRNYNDGKSLKIFILAVGKQNQDLFGAKRIPVDQVFSLISSTVFNRTGIKIDAKKYLSEIKTHIINEVKQEHNKESVIAKFLELTKDIPYFDYIPPRDQKMANFVGNLHNKNIEDKKQHFPNSSIKQSLQSTNVNSPKEENSKQANDKSKIKDEIFTQKDNINKENEKEMVIPISGPLENAVNSQDNCDTKNDITFKAKDDKTKVGTKETFKTVTVNVNDVQKESLSRKAEKETAVEGEDDSLTKREIRTKSIKDDCQTKANVKVAVKRKIDIKGVEDDTVNVGITGDHKDGSKLEKETTTEKESHSKDISVTKRDTRKELTIDDKIRVITKNAVKSKIDVKGTDDSETESFVSIKKVEKEGLSRKLEKETSAEEAGNSKDESTKKYTRTKATKDALKTMNSGVLLKDRKDPVNKKVRTNLAKVDAKAVIDVDNDKDETKGIILEDDLGQRETGSIKKRPGRPKKKKFTRQLILAKSAKNMEEATKPPKLKTQLRATVSAAKRKAQRTFMSQLPPKVTRRQTSSLEQTYKFVSLPIAEIDTKLAEPPPKELPILPPKRIGAKLVPLRPRRKHKLVDSPMFQGSVRTRNSPSLSTSVPKTRNKSLPNRPSKKTRNRSSSPSSSPRKTRSRSSLTVSPKKTRNGSTLCISSPQKSNSVLGISNKRKRHTSLDIDKRRTRNSSLITLRNSSRSIRETNPQPSLKNSQSGQISIKNRKRKNGTKQNVKTYKITVRDHSPENRNNNVNNTGILMEATAAHSHNSLPNSSTTEDTVTQAEIINARQQLSAQMLNSKRTNENSKPKPASATSKALRQLTVRRKHQDSDVAMPSPSGNNQSVMMVPTTSNNNPWEAMNLNSFQREQEMCIPFSGPTTSTIVQYQNLDLEMERVGSNDFNPYSNRNAFARISPSSLSLQTNDNRSLTSAPPAWFDNFAVDVRRHELWRMVQLKSLQNELVDMEFKKILILREILARMK